MKSITLFFTLLLATFSTLLQGQVSRDTSLYKELKKADSLLFDEGFNKCNFSALKTVLHDDLEFLHDQNGSQNLAQFYEAFTTSICSNPDVQPIRKLVDETLMVYALKDEGKVYGAIQTGDHKFYIKEPNKDLYVTQQAKFITTWVLENNQWKAKRIISYEHLPPPKEYGPKFDADYVFPLFENDKTIEQLLQKHKIPSVAIGLVKNGKVQQIRSFGVQKEAVSVSHNSIYKVASLTKPISAMVVLKLIDKGLWSLDEQLSKHHIDSDIATHQYLHKLRTRHVLSHQTGFPNWRYLNDDNRLTFEFEPGTQWQYSGEGFEYLRKAIESKLKRPFEDLAQELLFEPLQMQNTNFYWTAEVDENRYAVEHDENGEAIEFEKHIEANLSANLLTTAEDYAKFLAYIANGTDLSKTLYIEFITPQVNEKSGIDWGLGMQMLPELPNGDTALMHTGGDFGIKTIAITMKDSKDGLVIFSNSENGMVLWNKIISEYFGETGKEIVRRNIE